MEPISEEARKAAGVILNYVTIRFPAGHDATAHAIDAEWFAQTIQTALSNDRWEYRRQLALAAEEERRNHRGDDRLQRAAEKILSRHQQTNEMLPMAGGISQHVEESTDPAVMLAVDYMRNHAA